MPADDGTEAASPPKILVSTEPAELIVSEGKPSFKPVAGAGADLLSMENTESDVLLDVPTQNYYALLSGRWFRSKTLAGGAWTYVPPDSLPATFAKIPPDSDVGDIRASVPGTDEAEDAVLDAQIPQTTAVKRADARLDVQYDGEPKFVGIEGTRTEYAINTPTSVLRISGRYYACENAVWYVADSPTGPWLLADSVPTDDVDQIPPSVPVYNVKYVQIYDSTPDVVYEGYTPGYIGAYPWYGTVVWGTGWYYRPWIGPTYWWPRHCTWGFHAHYTPWSGWGFGSSWSFPFFSVSHGWGGWFRPVGLGPAALLGRGIPPGMVRPGRVSASDRHREQLLGQSPGRRPPARLESPDGRFRRRSAPPARAGSSPFRPAGHRLPSARTGRRASEDPEQPLHETSRPVARRPETPGFRQVPARHRPAEQRVCRQERRGLSQDEGRLAAAHERHVEEFGRRHGLRLGNVRQARRTGIDGAFAGASRASRRTARAAPGAGSRFLGPAARRCPRAELVASRGAGGSRDAERLRRRRRTGRRNTRTRRSTSCGPRSGLRAGALGWAPTPEANFSGPDSRCGV